MHDRNYFAKLKGNSLFKVGFSIYSLFLSDENRYAVEDARKGSAVNALRMMSGTETTEGENAQHHSEEDGFVEIPPEEEDENTSFAQHLWQNKRARHAVYTFAALALV